MVISSTKIALFRQALAAAVGVGGRVCGVGETGAAWVGVGWLVGAGGLVGVASWVGLGSWVGAEVVSAGAAGVWLGVVGVGVDVVGAESWAVAVGEARAGWLVAVGVPSPVQALSKTAKRTNIKSRKRIRGFLDS